MTPLLSCMNVTKKLRWHERNLSLKKTFTRLLQHAEQPKDWVVLSGINFDVGKGERVGIIGRNGSGKTTLLRLIAGIYAPSSGTIRVNAKRALALLELGVGFSPDLTGRENIRLNWVLNGLPLHELSGKLGDIIGFSGVSRFLDTPLKFYSSGMRARLGFAIAAHADPDLLILDEVLAVGDAEFQTRCRERIGSLCAAGTTLLLVSHNPHDVTALCERALWLDHGSIQLDGPSQNTVDHYLGATS